MLKILVENSDKIVMPTGSSLVPIDESETTAKRLKNDWLRACPLTLSDFNRLKIKKVPYQTRNQISKFWNRSNCDTTSNLNKDKKGWYLSLLIIYSRSILAYEQIYHNLGKSVLPDNRINSYKNNMDSHLYKDVHDENPYKNNTDSHLYKNVHDENPYKNNI